MSVFSLLKRSRQQAKEHKQKQAEKTAEPPKQPYRHVPTHAAIDALSGAPSAFKHEDRPKILEQNRRRSAMAASGLTKMPGPAGLPRVSSSLSQVTYPSVNASPMGSLPRAYSYSGVPPPAPYWQERNKSSIYSVPDGSRISLKGKEVDRSWGSGRNSPSSAKESPSTSSSRSTSSQEDLEMKPTRHQAMPPAHQIPAAVGHTHRLHPSSRRASDASERGDGSPKTEKSSTISTDRAKPPLSMRGFNAIPAMNALPPMQFGNSMLAQQSTVASSAASMTSVRSSSGLSSFNFNINPNAPFSAPMSGRSSAATTPAACVTPEPVYESVEEEEEGGSYTYAPPPASAAAVAPSAMKQRDRTNTSKPKVTRFTELEKIDSHPDKPTSIHDVPPLEDFRRDNGPPQMSNDAINKAVAVEIVTATPAGVVSSNKPGKRLSKLAGSKLTKKSLWSTKSSAVAV